MPRPPRVVITDCDHGTVAPETAVLAGRAELVAYERHAPGALVELAAGADAIITQYGAFTTDVLAALPRCRAIVRYGVGVDTIDVDAATRAGIVVANVPDYGVEEVSTHAVALALALHRRLVPLDRAVRAGTWEFRACGPIGRLSSLVAGVVGVGRIGEAVARKLAALGLHCLGVDPVRDDWPPALERVELAECLARADIVSLHCPLTRGTRHLIGRSALAAMKPTALLVNTARGGLVDTGALVDALRADRLGGAGLDVLEEEPLPAGHPLALDARVLLTPHVAFYSEGSILELKRRTAEAALDVLEGRRPASVVNPAVYARAKSFP